MKKKISILLILFIAFFASSCKTADKSDSTKDNYMEHTPKISSPILVTSLGQSIDHIMLERILDNLNLEYDSLPTSLCDDIKNYNTLLAVVGSSKKGMSFSDASLEDELKRINDINECIKDYDTNIILIHMGGKNRRGTISDEIIKAALPISGSIIVVGDGNYDNLFTDYAKNHNILSDEVLDMQELQNTIETYIEN